MARHTPLRCALRFISAKFDWSFPLKPSGKKNGIEVLNQEGVIKAMEPKLTMKGTDWCDGWRDAA
jgi:hypothetical protein